MEEEDLDQKVVVPKVNFFERLRNRIPSISKKLLTLLFILVAIPVTLVLALNQQTFFNHAAGPTSPNGDSTTTGASYQGSPIVIKTTNNLAGAIGSITWKGKEFINSYDHGRELQDAISFDYLGECYNPTEAGGGYDGRASLPSSSVLNYFSASGNKLSTITSPAFWTKPNTPYSRAGAGCGGQNTYHESQNKTIVSDYTMRKDVQIGYQNLPNVIEYKIGIHVPRVHDFAEFSPTGYMPKDFTKYTLYDPSISLESAYPSELGFGGQPIPIILSTQNDHYAMGVYSPDIPSNDAWATKGYMVMPDYLNLTGKDNGTMEWETLVFKGGQIGSKSVPAGDYNYRIYIIIGNRAQVKSTMTTLYGLLYQPPTGTITASPNPCLIEAQTTSCTSTISWSTQHATATSIKLASTGQTIAGGGSGSSTIPWIGTGTTTFILTEKNNELARVSVSGTTTLTPTPIPTAIPTPTPTPASGSITASPNPCPIVSGTNACANVTISWHAINTSQVTLKLLNSDWTQDVGLDGSAPMNWIGEGETTFVLYAANGQELSRVSVHGVKDSTPTPTAIPGDYDQNGIVNLADYNVWLAEFQGTVSTHLSDGNGDGIVDLLDYNIWQANYHT